MVHSNLKYYCDMCEKSFTTKSYLKVHIMLSHLPLREDFTCNTCSKKFALKYYLTSHVKKVHQNKKSSKKSLQKQKYSCEICSKSESLRTFSSKTDMYKHIAEFHCQKVSPFSCHECKKTFNSEDILKFHMKVVHPNIKVFDSVCLKMEP